MAETTCDKVLDALRTAGRAGLSGEKLAQELSVSRVAVSKHVASLRRMGYRIDALPGSGYRMIGVPDLPLPAEITPLLTTTLWTSLLGGGVTGSTNDDARALARAGAAEGTVVLASRQTDGRGRLGREWDSPEGGAYLSVILRPVAVPSVVASIALAMALGVSRGLRALGFSPEVKWPNDVLLGGRKVAGVLLEATGEADRLAWVVVGVGINVHPPQSGGADNAAWLGEIKPGIRVAEVAAAALDGIASAYVDWVSRGFGALKAEYEELATMNGCEVTVRDLAGKVQATGTACGVDNDGRLLVREHSGATVAIAAGDVTLREPERLLRR